MTSELAEDGLRSAQFEHTLLVTETGCDILTLQPEEDGKPHFMTNQTNSSYSFHSNTTSLVSVMYLYRIL